MTHYLWDIRTLFGGFRLVEAARAKIDDPVRRQYSSIDRGNSDIQPGGEARRIYFFFVSDIDFLLKHEADALF